MHLVYTKTSRRSSRVRVSKRKFGEDLPSVAAFPCLKCKKEVLHSDNAISCDKCDHWQHVRCIPSITLSFYRKVCKGLVQDFLWFCANCAPIVQVPVQARVPDNNVQVPVQARVPDNNVQVPVQAHMPDNNVQVPVQARVPDNNVQVPVQARVPDNNVQVPVQARVSDNNVQVPVQDCVPDPATHVFGMLDEESLMDIDFWLPNSESTQMLSINPALVLDSLVMSPLSQDHMPDHVYAPVQSRVPENVYAPVQACVPENVYAPVQARVPENVYAPVQAHVPDNVHVPVQDRVPDNNVPAPVQARVPDNNDQVPVQDRVPDNNVPAPVQARVPVRPRADIVGCPCP